MSESECLNCCAGVNQTGNFADTEPDPTPDQSLSVKRTRIRVQSLANDPLDTTPMTPIVNIKGSLISRITCVKPKPQPQQDVFGLKLTPLIVPVPAQPNPLAVIKKSISSKTKPMIASAPTCASELVFKLQKELRKPISGSPITSDRFETSPVSSTVDSCQSLTPKALAKSAGAGKVLPPNFQRNRKGKKKLNIGSRTVNTDAAASSVSTISGASVNRRKQNIATRDSSESEVLAEQGRLQVANEIYHEITSDFTCPICGKPCGHRSTLQMHLKSHKSRAERKAEKKLRALEDPASLTPRFLCTECGKTFASSGGLTQHIKLFHPSQSTPSKRFTCTEPDCTYSASASKSLKVHIAKRHSTSTLKFKCSRCSQGFRAAYELKNHQKSCCDPAERPHICLNCKKRYRLKHCLKLHYIQTHKMGKEVARALVYPGISFRSSIVVTASEVKKRKILSENPTE